jgi:hypothetical protein
VRITLSDLTVIFDHLDRNHVLDDWRWLIGPSKQPILLSAVGDAFVEDETDATIHLLDTAAGSCVPVAADEDELRALLGDSHWVADHLAVRVIADFRANGLRLDPGQIYSWKRPPVLGGEYELDNADATDIAVHFSVTGQIHQQVRTLPPGTPVTEIHVQIEPD